MVLNKRDLERAFSPKKVKSRKSFKTIRPAENFGAKPNNGPSSNIKVFVRVRPFNGVEQTQNHKNTIKIIDDKMLIFDPKEESQGFFFHGVKQKTRDIAKKQNKEMQFMFDRVFNGEENNVNVYQGTTQGIISTLLEGYNCSVFVYGATGAGKTHTMLGNKDNPGITVLTMQELYNQVEELKATKEIEIGVTYLEVYNENVHDLINPSGPMHVRDDASGGVSVAGMKVEKIEKADQLFNLLQRGNMNRTQHPTDANAESSRSHAVFQVYVKIQTKASGDVKFAKLSMIDLAGSERGAATGCAGARFKEGSNINKSLLALGNCINNLAEGLRHIPYRDSKLTRILKDSLGGNCHTIMIANVSPSALSYEDTYNTLKYATRAKSIKSQLSKNVMSVNLRVEHYVKINAELKRENEALKDQVKALDRALHHPAVSPPRADPSYVEKLNDLYREKKQVHSEWFTLEAQLKLLQWRVRCKTLGANHMKNQMDQYGEDYSQELIKTEKSLQQLEARAISLVERMAELGQHKVKHYEAYNKFTQEMEEAKVTKLLQSEAKLKELQCENVGMQIQQEHHQKIINMQEKRLESLQSMIDHLTKISSDYHLILRGQNLITDTMHSEYQMGQQKMRGLKAVSWIDMEDGSDDEQGVALSSVSVRPYVNLTLSTLYSSSFPICGPEERPKIVDVAAPSLITQPVNTNDLNGTFVLNSSDLDDSSSLTAKPSKIAFVVPKQIKTTKPPLQSRKFTPAHKMTKNNTFINKENIVSKVKLGVSCSFPTPQRPKSALASRQVNILDPKKPDSNVSLSSGKMVRDKNRIHQLNHPYNRPVKLKRLGSTTPNSAIKKTPRI